MARIVLVHGAFNELWGPHEIAARWVPALRDGLWHHGVDVDPGQVAVCFYGDLFRRDPEAADAARFAAARPAIAEQLASLAGGELLDAIGDATSAALADRTIDMVTTMATMPDLREQLQQRIEPLVDDGTVAVVGHSLGSVLSYLWLCRHPHRPVDTFVTLGSPLGSQQVRTLLAGFVEEPGAWPGSVRRWVNVMATGDKVAAAPLAPIYGDAIDDVHIDNGPHAHHPEPYLNAAATGAVLAEALAR